MNCIELFTRTYKRYPDGILVCPYRVCPLGAHVDHNLGRITGLALDKGISIAYHPKQNGVIELASLQFEKRAQWHISAIPKQCEGDWADYLRGATIAVSKRHELRKGMCAVIEGSLPIGGISSSAAVTIAYISALCKCNEIALTQSEIIELALEAEHDYMGISVGKLDQSCEVLSKRDNLLYLDTADDSYELIPQSHDMKPYEIAIFFSGLDRSLANSRFNTRVDELRSAAYALEAYAGMDYGKYNETYMRQVPRQIFEKYKNRLPDNWRKRAEHWFTEWDRVEQGVNAWRRGDIVEFGRLSFESGWSSIHNWESGAPEQITLYEIMTQTDGIYGGRFSGAGFKGCCMALIDPSFRDSIERQVTERYLSVYPHLKGKYSFHICHSADGVAL